MHLSGGHILSDPHCMNGLVSLAASQHWARNYNCPAERTSLSQKCQSVKTSPPCYNLDLAGESGNLIPDETSLDKIQLSSGTLHQKLDWNRVSSFFKHCCEIMRLV